MGCDIHMFAEVRNKETKKWEFTGPIFKHRNYQGVETISREPYSGRNYSLFAVLANVRNDDGIIPISDPKGLPDQMSDFVRYKAQLWEADGHSHSFFLLKELIDFSWNQEFNESGMVSQKQKEAYEKDGKRPESWCKWTNQKDYVQMSWPSNIKFYCEDFVENTIPQLQALGDPEDVRIIFWFDN